MTGIRSLEALPNFCLYSQNAPLQTIVRPMQPNSPGRRYQRMHAIALSLVTPCSNECFVPKTRTEKLIYGVYAETFKVVRFMARFKSSCVKGVSCTAGTPLGLFESLKSIVFVMGSEFPPLPAVASLEMTVVMH